MMSTVNINRSPSSYFAAMLVDVGLVPTQPYHEVVEPRERVLEESETSKSNCGEAMQPSK